MTKNHPSCCPNQKTILNKNACLPPLLPPLPFPRWMASSGSDQFALWPRLGIWIFGRLSASIASLS